MNENEDGTGSPTPSSFSIQIPSLTSNNTRRDFNVKNPKIFYINFSFINFLLISRLIYILHIIMTIDDYVSLITNKFDDLKESLLDHYFGFKGLNCKNDADKSFDLACKENNINNWL